MPQGFPGNPGGGGGTGNLETIGNPTTDYGTLNFNPAPYDDSSALYSQGDTQSVFADFRIKHHYERDLHRYMMGIASPGGFQNKSVAFVQLAAPTLLWIADWTGNRFLKKAVIPDPTAVNPDWVLLDAWLEPYMIVLSTNGTTPLYRLSGVYVYGHPNPGSHIYDNACYPLAPWIKDQEGGNGQDGYLVRTIDANDLQSYLLEPQGVAAGIPGGGLNGGVTFG